MILLVFLFSLVTGVQTQTRTKCKGQLSTKVAMSFTGLEVFGMKESSAILCRLQNASGSLVSLFISAKIKTHCSAVFAPHIDVVYHKGSVFKVKGLSSINPSVTFVLRPIWEASVLYRSSAKGLPAVLWLLFVCHGAEWTHAKPEASPPSYRHSPAPRPKVRDPLGFQTLFKTIV